MRIRRRLAMIGDASRLPTMLQAHIHKSSGVPGQTTCRIATILVALICMVCLNGAALQGQVGGAQPDAMAEVESALSGHAYDHAVKTASASLQAHPDDYRMWTLQGMAYAGANSFAAAAEAYRRALRLRPNYLPALEGIAQVEYQQGSPSAELHLSQLIALHPADPTAHAMLAVLEYKSGACKEAILHFQKAQAVIGSQYVPVSEFGVCLAKLDRFEEAIPVLQQAIALDPGGSQARHNLALVFWKSKKYEEAIAVLEPELQSSSVNEDTLTLAADIYEAMNDTPRAVELLRRAIAAKPLSPNAYLWLATLSNDHGSYKVGIDILDAGLARIPEAAQLYLTRGVLYAQIGEFDKAMGDFETANRLDPRLSFAGTAEGITETQKHDSAQGLAKFREQVRLHPENAFNQYMLAETLYQKGVTKESQDYNEELRAGLRAVQLDPHLALAHNLLADIYLQSGRTNLAIQHCEKVLQFDASNQEALYHLILALRKTDRIGETAALTKRLVALRMAASDKDSHMNRYVLVEGADEPHSPDSQLGVHR